MRLPAKITFIVCYKRRCSFGSSDSVGDIVYQAMIVSYLDGNGNSAQKMGIKNVD